MHNTTTAKNGKDEKSRSWSIVRACTDPKLSSEFGMDYRMLLITMARLADGPTLTGYHSQATIAAAMGCSVSTVKRLWRGLPKMVEAGLAPVDIKRRRRGRSDGTGRDSDQWTLVLLAPAQEVSLTPSAPANENSKGQTETLKGSNEKAQGVNLTYDLLSVSPLSPKEKQTPPSAVPILAKPIEKANTDHEQIHSYYIAEFKRLRTGATPVIGYREHKAIKKLIGKLPNLAEAKRRITNGLTNWDCETINGIAADPDKYIKTKTHVSQPSGTMAYAGPSKAEVIATGRLENQDRISAMSDDVRAEFEEMLRSGQYTVEHAISCLRDKYRNRPLNPNVAALLKGVG